MRNYQCILVLFILSTLMTLPLFHGKIIQGYDIQHAFIETVSMYQSWSYGDFTGRWTPDILQGYGYPTLNYYPPLFFYITAGLSVILKNLFWGFNLGLFLMLFSSGLAMYLYAKEFWSKQGALLSAIAYLLAPYHILDLYVRGACAEFTSFVFVPLTLYALHRLSTKPKILFFLLATLSLTGLLLSHNIIALFSFPLLVLYALIMMAQKRFDIRWGIIYVSIFVLALGLSSYFWAPAILEQKYIQIHRIAKTFDYRQHFLYWDQLFYSAWGYGGSGPGRADSMSFQIGPIHLLLAMIMLFRFKHLNFENKNQHIFIVFWILVGLGATLMTLEISAFVWKAFPMLSAAAFPWRFLMIVAFVISLLAGGICDVFKKERAAICLLGATLLIAFNIFYCRDFGYLNLTLNDPKEFLRKSYPMENMAFLPKDVKILRLVTSRNKLEIAQGKGAILDYQSSSGLHHRYVLLALTPTLIIFHTYYFPGWEVMIDNKRAPILSDNPYGLIAFIVPEGEHIIKIDFKSTPIRTITERISIGVLFVLIIIFLLRRKIDRIL